MNTLKDTHCVETLSMSELSTLPAPQLATLLDDLAGRKSRLADLEQKLISALDLRYGARASQRRAGQIVN